MSAKLEGLARPFGGVQVVTKRAPGRSQPGVGKRMLGIGGHGLLEKIARRQRIEAAQLFQALCVVTRSLEVRGKRSLGCQLFGLASLTDAQPLTKLRACVSDQLVEFGFLAAHRKTGDGVAGLRVLYA